jgi:carboxypeptidase family protein
VASLRETTTLITLDGTLLHRDQITLRPGAIGTALDLTLAAGSTLWSARVDGVPVRPLERGSGRISVPLGFDTGRDAVVEVVSVQEKAVPKGRSELALDVPRVAVPVLEHRWRLLLPDGARYRYRSGDLRPAAESVVIHEVTRRETEPTANYGPGGNAVLRGVVLDDRSAELPGATVTLQTDQGPRVAVTDARGAFAFPALFPGSYVIKAELEGFATLEYPSIRLNAGEVASLELRLSAAVEDVITVQGEEPLFGFKGGLSRPKKDEADRNERLAKGLYDQEIKSLRQGLVGGVKPLPVAIPESGKLLLLSGVLPPERIGVELEVKK